MKKKIYIIYYTWASTKNNHAGMSYFVNQLKLQSEHDIQLIQPPTLITSLIKKHYYASRIWQQIIAFYLKLMLRKNDSVMFMEYLGGWRCGGHSNIARLLKKWNIKNHRIGMVHLAKNHILESYTEENMVLDLEHLNSILVMGSSLEKDIASLGFNNVVRTYHYVDTNYYHPLVVPQKNNKLTVIAMGTLKRNHALIFKIAKNCPNIDFLVCAGRSTIDSLTEANVTVLGYMEESEMLSAMQKSDISLSIMEDTIGSNVIATSLACGLINVVSDVGSIHDYCSLENSVFCLNENDFIKALNTLAKDKNIALKKEHARNKAIQISLDKSIQWYDGFFKKA